MLLTMTSKHKLWLIDIVSILNIWKSCIFEPNLHGWKI